MKGCCGALFCFVLGCVIVYVAFLLGRASRSPQAEKTGKVTVEDLVSEMKSAEERARKSAVKALGEKGAEAEAAVPELIKVLKDQSEAVQEAAAEALEKIGPKARAALPALKEQLKNGTDAVRAAARKAIERIERFRDQGAETPPEKGPDPTPGEAPSGTDHKKNEGDKRPP